jgi:aminoglycoside phosphotransferase family enzyme
VKHWNGRGRPQTCQPDKLPRGPCYHRQPLKRLAGLFVGNPVVRLPDLTAKIRFLRSAVAWGPQGQSPQCVQTHMSWVFLTPTHVYKLKKPLQTPWLDFQTLAAREFYCREELRLNARLAPQVYLGLVALQWTPGGLQLVPENTLLTHPHAQPAAETVDWLVCMRRLPAQRMLSHRMRERRLAPGEVDALAARLTRFFQTAARADVSPQDYCARFEQEQAATAGLLLDPRFALRGAAQAVAEMARALPYSAHGLRQRAQSEVLRDGHGDLRPEHICLLSPPVVIDCLEFNASLRQLDPWDELAYLALECSMAGQAWAGERLLGQCAAVLGAPQAALVHFYAAHRALMRARLSVAHLLESPMRAPQRWIPLAERYVAQALDRLDALVENRPYS